MRMDISALFRKKISHSRKNVSLEVYQSIRGKPRKSLPLAPIGLLNTARFLDPCLFPSSHYLVKKNYNTDGTATAETKMSEMCLQGHLLDTATAAPQPTRSTPLPSSFCNEWDIFDWHIDIWPTLSHNQKCTALLWKYLKHIGNQHLRQTFWLNKTLAWLICSEVLYRPIK